MLDDALAAVAPIVADVRERGDLALLEWTERFDGPRNDGIRVDAGRIAAAAVEDDVLESLRRMIEAVRAFNEAQVPADTSVEAAPGIVSERRWVPLDAVGLCVPSGRVPLPSSLVMTAVPALVAGVRRLVVVTPNPAEATLVVARELGIAEVYAVGGAQAVAALAYGTDTIEPVDTRSTIASARPSLGAASTEPDTGTISQVMPRSPRRRAVDDGYAVATRSPSRSGISC